MNTKSELSRGIITACLDMNRSGLNQGTSGNISCRFEDGMLITPSSTPYDTLKENDIVFISNDGVYDEDKTPSSEWRFHQTVYQARPDLNAVVHCHALYSSTLAIMNKGIPAIHYMVAASGGKDIPCIPYATYGTSKLSDRVAAGFAERNSILMQHHGMTAGGDSLAKAMWLATETETLAKMYVNLLQMGVDIPLLCDEEMETILGKFNHYGLQEKGE